MKKFLTIMLAIAIVAMYTFGSIGTVFAGGTSTTQNASITTSKTASWADGATNKDASIANVNLTLDCQNAVQVTTSSTRIVLVLDRSGSMGDKTNGVSKLDRLKSTLTTADTGFIDKVLGIPNADVQIAVVSYSSDETAGYDKYGVLHAGCSQVTTNSGFSSSAADLKAAVNGIDAWGGTNTQAGIRQAESLLSTEIADNEYIILLSDGEPTFSYKATAAVPADTGLNYNSTEWTSRITEFSNDIVGTGDSYYFTPYSLTSYTYTAETFSSTKGLDLNKNYYYANDSSGNKRLIRYDDGDGISIDYDPYYYYMEPTYHKHHTEWNEVKLQDGDTVYKLTVTNQGTINNNGYGTVSEAYLAKATGSTIYTIGYDVAAGSTSDKVMKSVASSNDNSFVSGISDLNSIFTTIGQQIKEQAAGTGAVVSDILGSSSVAGSKYEFDIVPNSISVTYKANPTATAVAMPNAATYDSNSRTITWNVEDGNLKQGTYSLSYQIKFKNYSAMKGADVKDLSTVLSNNDAVLNYKDSASANQSLTFTKPTLGVTQYTVHYFYSDDNGNKYTEKTDKAVPHTAIVGCSAIVANDANGIITDGAVTGYTYDKIEYGTDKNTTGLAITDTAANNVINVYYKETGKVSKSVEKIWAHSGDNYSAQPEKVTVALMDGTTELTTQDLSAANNWKYTFANLQAYRDLAPINYTIVEKSTPAGYTMTSTVDGDKTTITNTYSGNEKIDKTFTKTWDLRDQGTLPSNITVKLQQLKDGNLVDVANSEKVVSADEQGKWSCTWTGLDKYYKGSEAVYTVAETKIGTIDVDSNGMALINGSAATAAGVRQVIGYWQWLPDTSTNTWVPAEDTASGTVTINKYGVSELTATAKANADVLDGAEFTLYSGTKAVGTYTTAEDGTASITGLAAGTYTLKETNAPDGYTASSNTWTVTVSDTSNTLVSVNKDSDGIFHNIWSMLTGVTATANSDFTVSSSTLSVYDVASVSKTVQKVWNDNNNQDGVRPDSVKIDLYAQSGSGTATKVKTLTLDKSNWSGSFTDLPKYDAAGNAITYSVQEQPIAVKDGHATGYTASVAAGTADNAADFVVTNTHTPETVSKTVTKVWNDDNNQAGDRPQSVSVQLSGDGAAVGSAVAVTGGSNAGTWTYTWNNLPKYSNGKAISYAAAETAVPANYKLENQLSDTPMTITNTYNVTNTTAVTATKYWEDNSNQDGMRTASVKVQLYKNNDPVGAAKTLNADNNWSYTWTNLYIKSNGTNNVYTVQEVTAVTGYEANVTTQDGYTFAVTNSHEPETISKSVTKIWKDDNNQDHSRPTSIEVYLLGNGETVMEPEKDVTAQGANDDSDSSEPQEYVLTLNDDNDWTGTWYALPKYSGGELISYEAVEREVNRGDLAQYSPSQNFDENGNFILINTRQSATVTRTVSKLWNDGDNMDSIRPAYVKINLLANGTPLKTVNLSADNNWKATWTDLPANSDGTAITYSVTEDAVSGYNAEIRTDGDNFYITNYHTVLPVKVTYHANGGVGDDVVYTINKGTDYTVLNNMFTRVGFTFTGWTTNANGTGTAYAADNTIANVKADVELYANWTQDVIPPNPPIIIPPTPPIVDPGDNNETPEPTPEPTPIVDPGDNNNTPEPVVVPDEPDNNNAEEPKTGDENNMVPWAITLLTGALLTGVVIKRRDEE